jgi:hypothetical protein
MEVPCCHGLVQIVRLAVQAAGKDIPLTLREVTVRGQLAEEEGKGM